MAPPSWAAYDQQAFLTAQVSDYLTAQKEKSLTSFWARLYEGWFQKFPQVMPGKSLDALSDDEKELLGDAIRVHQKVNWHILCTPKSSSHVTGIETTKLDTMEEWQPSLIACFDLEIW